MNDSASLKSNPVLKCKITVKKNGSGYDVKYDPEIIPVALNNTDVHFHIDAQTSDAVEIDSVTYKPEGQTQLVDQKISSNRQQLSLKDLNTVEGTFILSFTYKDKNGSRFTSSSAKGPECQTIDVPQVNNNPPGFDAVPEFAGIDVPQATNNPPG